MALLREQKNLIKTLHCIHENETLSNNDTKKLVHAFLGLSSDAEAFVHLRNHRVLLTDKSGQFPKKVDDKGYFGRALKIATLFQSCIDSGFLIPVENVAKEDKDKFTYYRISDKGSDLLHPLGLCQIAFEKYSKIIVFFWGALSIIALKALTYIFANWQAIKTAVFN